jgi:hypothetical protein
MCPGLKDNTKFQVLARPIIRRVWNHTITVKDGIKEFADLYPSEIRLEMERYADLIK